MRSCYTNTFSFVFMFVFFTFYYEIFDECEHFVAYSEEYHKTTLTKKQMTQIFLMKALQEALRAFSWSFRTCTFLSLHLERLPSTIY